MAEKCFIIWMASAWERFLVEKYETQTTALCRAKHNTHVPRFVERIQIHVVMFMVTQCRKVRTQHYVLQQFFLYAGAVRMSNTAQLFKLDYTRT
jgi:hypothetical protein